MNKDKIIDDFKHYFQIEQFVTIFKNCDLEISRSFLLEYNKEDNIGKDFAIKFQQELIKLIIENKKEFRISLNKLNEFLDKRYEFQLKPRIIGNSQIINSLNTRYDKFGLPDYPELENKLILTNNALIQVFTKEDYFNIKQEKDKIIMCTNYMFKIFEDSGTEVIIVKLVD